MPLVAAYHRPGSLEEALNLLSRPDRVPLAGGTTLNADRVPSNLEAVDLQDLELNQIRKAPDRPPSIEVSASLRAVGLRPTIQADGRVSVGATATLDAVRRCDLLPDSVRDLARAEQPSTLRTLATVGGLVARACSESLLLAALLAHGGEVSLARLANPPNLFTPDLAHGGEVSLAGLANPTDPGGCVSDHQSLAELWAAGLTPGSLITEVTVDPAGQTASAGTGRTPADTPIVGVYARRTGSHVTMAVSGVAEHPVLVDAADPTAGLDPVGDFRGSREYRLHLAATLAARVIRGLG